MISIVRSYSPQRKSISMVRLTLKYKSFIVEQSYANIVQLAFNSPIIVHDYMAFAMLSQKFKTNVFVIYCDKKDKKLYD